MTVQPVTTIAVTDAVIATCDTTTFPDDWYVLEVLVLDSAGVQGDSLAQDRVGERVPSFCLSCDCPACGVIVAHMFYASVGRRWQEGKSEASDREAFATKPG